VVNASKFLLGTGILFEQQAQFQQSTVDLTQSEQIRSLLVEIQVHLSNALNSRGRQRASWRNRVINSISSISELSHQILTIWPEIYEEVEESLDSTLYFRQQAPFRKKVCNIDKYGFPDVIQLNSPFVIQSKRTKPHKTEMSQFTFQVMCEVLTLATMLQKWHDYAYDDYKENNKELPKFVIEWLDLLIEQSHVLKSNMLGHDTMDEVSLSTEEDESSNTTDESSKPLLSESFGTNFDTSKPEKETPKHSIGDKQSSIHFVKSRPPSIAYGNDINTHVYGSNTYEGGSRKSVRDQGSAFFG
jgi:hypothetical protein